MEWIDAHLFDESHAVHGDGRMLCSSSIATSSDLHDPRTAGGKSLQSWTAPRPRVSERLDIQYVFHMCQWDLCGTGGKPLGQTLRHDSLDNPLRQNSWGPHRKLARTVHRDQQARAVPHGVIATLSAIMPIYIKNGCHFYPKTFSHIIHTSLFSHHSVINSSYARWIYANAAKTSSNR